MAPKVTDERAVSASTLDDIWAALKRIENGGNGRLPPAPAMPPTPWTTDPTLNVKEAMNKDEAHRKEIRDIDQEHRKEIREIQERCNNELAEVKRENRENERRASEAERKQEMSRVDAKFADIVQSALLVQQTTASTAQALSATLANATEALRKSQETTDIATRAAIRAVEQNQATGGGASAQQRESRLGGERVTQLVIAAVGVALAGLIFYSNQQHTAPQPVTVTVVAPTPAPTK